MCFHTHSSIKGLLTLFLLIFLGGCAGNFENFEYVDLQPQAVGFEAPIPRAGTRVVVWGNHSMAVDNVSMWLHERGLVVLDRTKMQQGFNGKEPRFTGSSKDWTHILEAGKQIGADLVTFVEVSNVKEGQKFELSQVRSSPTFSLTVEIRGVEPATGEIVTKSKAWQTGPAQDPNMVIEDLTARALDGAWQPASALIGKAKNKAEPEIEEGNLLQPVLTPFSQEVTSKEESTGHHSRTSVVLLEPDLKIDQENNQEMSLLQQYPNSMIASQNASSRETLEVNPIKTPSSQLPQNHNQGSQVDSTPVSKQLVTASTVLDDQSRFHNKNEVDSTYLNGLEPIPDSTQNSDSSSESLGSHVASGALSILYTPAKLVYAGLGGVFGGLAYILTAGDERAADSIWTGSLQGDFYITPAHLRGDTPLQFMGMSSSENQS
ncbi:MAG: hypothetical protein ACPGYT_12490 [Nitrospirales bacterium]